MLSFLSELLINSVYLYFIKSDGFRILKRIGVYLGLSQASKIEILVKVFKVKVMQTEKALINDCIRISKVS